MSITQFITQNIGFENGYLITAITLGFMFVVVYDFYHLLFSSIFSWFKK